MDNKLSVVIITKNEESKILDAIKSVNFAAEIVIIDSGSSDRTCEIAREAGAVVIHQDWLGYGEQKNMGVSHTKNDWVMVLDADERVTKELKNEIEMTLLKPIKNGYFIPRRNFFFGKLIRFCGLYPDYSLRLFKKDKGHFVNTSVHERVIIEGKPGHLINPMLHLAYESVS